MADQKISQLPTGGTLEGDELVPLVQDGATVRKTLTQLQSFIVDGDTAYLDVAQDWSSQQTFNNGVHIGEPDSSTPAQLVWERNELHRWSLFRNTTTESGADAGSNLELYSHDDAGNIKSLIFRVTRSTGVLNFNIQPTISGSNILKASDIGSSVQAYDVDTAKLDVAQTWTANQSFNTAIRPTTNDLAALGTSTLGWSDLWLADGGGIIWNNSLSLYHSAGRLAINHSGGALTLSLYRGDTPVGTQTGGITSYEGLDQAGNFQQYGRQYCFHAATANGSETGWFVWSLASAGSFADRMQMTPTVLRPSTNDAMSLGEATLSWSDLFLASGGAINFNNGDVTLTHATDSLTLLGGRFNFVQGSASANPSILVTQDNDTAQPIVAVFQGDRATPTNGDSAVIALRLSDSAGNQDTVAQIQWGLGVVTSGAETGYLRFALVSSGTLTNRLDLYNTNLSPVFDDGLSLGTTSNKWSDLFLASGAVINFNNGDVTLTHSTDILTMAGGQLYVSSSTAASTAVVRVMNTTDNASVVTLRLEGDRATPTNNDAVYSDWVLSDSAGNQDIFARWLCMGTSVTSTSEAALFRLSLITAGTLTATHEFTPTQIRPAVNDVVALGGASLSYSDLFLASGAVINFNNGNATLTHSTGRIASSVPVGMASYTVAGLPAGSTGDIAYASNGRKNGEGAGLGTGVLVFKDATAWIACDTGAAVAA